MSRRVAAPSARAPGEVSRQRQPVVILDHRLEREGLPGPWLSHGHCVQSGMEKCIDVCWFCVTSDLSHNELLGPLLALSRQTGSLIDGCPGSAESGSHYSVITDPELNPVPPETGEA